MRLSKFLTEFLGKGYSCTNSKSRDSRRELSNSRRELSISLLEFRNSRLYPIYNSQKQTRITYFSVEKTIKKTAILVVRISRLHENYFSLDKRDIQISVNPWFSSSVILVYTRITFLLAIEKQQISVSRELLFSTREKVNFSLFSIPLDTHPSLAHHLLFSTGNYSILLHTTQRSIQCLLISSTCSPMVLHFLCIFV